MKTDYLQNILPKHHPVVLRRLVKELNRHLASGFIVPGNQGGLFNNAKYDRKLNRVLVRRINPDWSVTDWKPVGNALDAGIYLPNGNMVTISLLTNAALLREQSQHT